MRQQPDAMIANRTAGATTYPKRHLFLDIDNLVEWGKPWIFQHFPRYEPTRCSGLASGPRGTWDARVSLDPGTVLYDGGRFRCWGYCMPGIESLDEGADCNLTAYAESDDGLHWTRPDLGITGRHRWPGNNLLKIPGCVMSVVRTLPGAPCAYFALTIQTDAPYPDVCDDGSIAFNGGGAYLFGSDDGLHWRQLTRYPIIVHGDVAALHVDPVQERYLLYQKVALNHGLTSRRSFIALESRDGITWDGYDSYRRWHEAFVCDDYDDLIAAQHGFLIGEFYGQTIHQVDGLYLALQNLFLVDQPLRPLMGQNPYGHAQLRLAFSHDGLCWRHPKGRPAFVEMTDPGDYGAGFLWAATNILEKDDDMWIYFSSIRCTHGFGIRPDFRLDPDLAFEEQDERSLLSVIRMKRDRFAGIASNHPTTFDVEIGPKQANGFTLNLVTRGRGSARVAFAAQEPPLHVCPRRDEGLPGYTFADCLPLAGDHARAPVRFRQAAVAGLPDGVPLVLRVQLDAGEVFGYEWDDGAA